VYLKVIVTTYQVRKMERFIKGVITIFIMKFENSGDEFIYNMRVARWVVNGSLDDKLELKLTPDHSRLRVRARIEKLPDDSYRTRRMIYFRGGKRTQSTYYSSTKYQVMVDFRRIIDSLVAACIDGETNDPRLLKFYEAHKVK